MLSYLLKRPLETMKPTRPRALKKARADGFTLTELLVVIVTVAVLSLLLLPALAGTKPDSQAFQCLENLRRLTLGWQMYAEDNNGKLPPNGEQGEQPFNPTDPNYQPGGHYAQWCPGTMTTFSTYWTNYIQNGLIYPYVKSVNAYHCPADQSAVKFGPYSFPHPRSYSMNSWVSPFPVKDVYHIGIGGSQPARIFYKDTDIILPDPAMTFVFIGESEKSIDDGYFACTPALPNYWINAPSTRHNDASGLSFADGHSEMKRWTDKYVLNPPTAGGSRFGSDPASGDNAWLEQRESSLP